MPCTLNQPQMDKSVSHGNLNNFYSFILVYLLAGGRFMPWALEKGFYLFCLQIKCGTQTLSP